MSCSEKAPQKPESGPDKKPPDEASKTIPVLIQRTTSSSKPCSNVMNIDPYNNKTVTNQSWASNYLQSIGLTYDKTIFKRKMKMNSIRDNLNNFLTQDSTLTTVADVNVANVMPNVNFNNVCNPIGATHENDASFTNYSNYAPTTEIHATMPATTYVKPYVNPYVNENNNYYFNQPKDNVANCEFPIIYYDSVTTPQTIVDDNLPSTYSKVFDQSNNYVSNNIYYDSNETSQVVGVNLPVTYSDQHNIYYGQKNILCDNNIKTSTTCDNYNTTLTATVEKNLETFNSVNDNSIYANSSTTFNESNVENSHNIERTTQESTSSNTIEENNCCNCLCSKLKQDKKQNKEEENNTAKKLENVYRSKVQESENNTAKKLEDVYWSKVQESERKFRDFLYKLNIESQCKQEKNQVKSKEKNNEDNIEHKSGKQTNSQEDKETHPKPPKKKDVHEQEPPTKNEKRKAKEFQLSEKTTKVVKTKHVNERQPAVNRKRKEVEFQHDEEIRPKFTKTKYVNERELTENRKRKEVEFLHDELTRPKFIKTKYVNEREPTVNRKRKEAEFQHDEETRLKFIKTKYVDEREPTVHRKKEIEFQNDGKTRPKFIKTKYVNEREPTVHKKKKEVEIRHDEETRSKFVKTKYVDEREPIVHRKKKEVEFQHDEETRPKFLKTKYVDEPEPIVNKKRKEVELQHDEETRPKFIKTKYVDEQEPIYKPNTKARFYDDYEKTNYNNPEYKPIKNARIDSKYEIPKSEMSKSKRPTSENELSERKSKRECTSHEVRKSKTESTKYYTYRSKDSDETNKTSPVKSIVKISKKHDSKKSSHHDISENEDLRDILSRKLHKNENILEVCEHDKPKTKSSDVSGDNLIITVNNNIGEIEKLPEKSLEKRKSKCESRKKINLVINIVYKQPGIQSESDKSDNEDHAQQAHSDLSFLDEINVDEIVESLNKTEKMDIHKNSINDEPNSIPKGKNSNKRDTSNNFIKKENLEIDKSEVFVANGDLLNNLFLKEASLLDSLRIVHQEIETEKRCMDNYCPKDEELCQSENKYVANGKLEVTDIKNVKVFTQSVNERKSNEKIKNISENNEDSMILQKSKDQTQAPMLISNLLERIKQHETKDKIDKPIKTHISNEQPQKITNIEVCPTWKEIKKQSENKNNQHNKTVGNKIENKQEPITETIMLDEELHVPTIDLSNDDSNDGNNMQQIPLKTTINKEQPINSVPKEILDTVDLTLDDNTNNQTVLNSAIKDIQDQKLFEKNSAKAFVDETIADNQGVINKTFITGVQNEFLIEGETMLETMTIQDSIDSKTNNDTINILQDKTNENMIEELAINQKPLDIENNINTEATPNTQTMIPPSDLSIEPETRTPKDCNIIQIKKMDNEPILDIAVGTSESLAQDCYSTEVQEKNIGVKLSDDKNVRNVNVEEENYHTSLLNIANSINAQEVQGIQNMSPLNQKDVKFDKNILIDMDTVNATETLTGETEVNEKNVRDNEPDPDIQILNEKYRTQVMDTRNEVNANENKSSIQHNKCSNTQNDNDNDLSNTKDIVSAAPNLKSSSSSTSNKDETKETFDSVKNRDNYEMEMLATTIKDKNVAIAGRLEREMFQCFKEKFTVISLIHSGSFSKIFRCRNDKVGRDYVVKSLNSSISMLKNAKQKDMLFALQSGSMRTSYPCVYLINSFPLYSRLCYFMDYYPKNLKRALEENAKPFHINGVQHLANQLVSAVMLLKGHDIVHLDIKPSHILLNHTNSQLKLCGFDAIREVNKIPTNVNIGTVNYRPPEVIIGYKLGFDIDVWATGLIFYEMATNIQLFPGVENNDVLFKQMCTLGSLPIEMIHRSHFGYKHFTGSNFKRVMGKSNKINIITKFHKSNRLEHTIIKAYNMYWKSKASKQASTADVDKIMFFVSLLKDMLQVDPTDRMPIQFVNAHPFLTDERY